MFQRGQISAFSFNKGFSFGVTVKEIKNDLTRTVVVQSLKELKSSCVTVPDESIRMATAHAQNKDKYRTRAGTVM
jgi:hypothetical protein